MKRSLLLLVIASIMLVLTTSACHEKAGNTAQPQTTVTVPVTHIGWGSLTPQQRSDLVELGKAHIFGEKVFVDPPMDQVHSVTYISDIPSPSCQKQTLIEYGYNGSGRNKILIQGHLEGIRNVQSIPDVLNNVACCYKYGGCIKEHECTESFPEPQKCKPCEQPPKVECKPCKQGKSPGKKQGDGVAQEAAANGNDHKIISTW